MGLAALDYLVIGAYLSALVAFGAWFARFQKDTRDYFLTDRSVPWWAICFTIVATETSTLTFIGVPAMAYAGNMTFLQIAFGYVIGRIVVGALFIPAYFRGELFTSYELLQRRFGAPVKNVAAAIFLGTRAVADGIRLFATALVVAIVTGVAIEWTIVVLGLAMIVYTERGGVSAVIWTDVVQMFVYVAGALLVFGALVSAIPGGWTAVLEAGRAGAKFTVLDLSLDATRAYTLWAGVVGGMFLTLSTHGTDQFLVQRFLSGRSPREAAAGLVLSGLLVLLQFVLFLVIGVMLYTYYQQQPLPMPLERNDQILPIFVVSELPGGAAGFIVAAIVAAALSPSLNAMAATTVNDFYVKYVHPSAGESTLMRVSRLATVFWGLVQIGVALGSRWMDRSVLDAGLAVLSVPAGPVLGAFLLGLLTRRLQAWPVVAGMIGGTAALLAIYRSGALAFTWFPFVGALITMAVAGLASVLARAAGPALAVRQ
jgi:SSS family transporter